LVFSLEVGLFDGMLAPARFRQQPDHDVCGCFVWFSPGRLASAAAPQTALHKAPLNRPDDRATAALRNGSAEPLKYDQNQRRPKTPIETACEACHDC
jgi:hypothetical protein